MDGIGFGEVLDEDDAPGGGEGEGVRGEGREEGLEGFGEEGEVGWRVGGGGREGSEDELLL